MHQLHPFPGSDQFNLSPETLNLRVRCSPFSWCPSGLVNVATNHCSSPLALPTASQLASPLPNTHLTLLAHFGLHCRGTTLTAPFFNTDRCINTEDSPLQAYKPCHSILDTASAHSPRRRSGGAASAPGSLWYRFNQNPSNYKPVRSSVNTL